MLIEFNVRNYRSIHSNQTLSMVAAKDDSLLATNCIQSGMSSIPYLVRSAVLYGVNASGKSNLIFALIFMRHMVETSAVATIEGQTIPVSPFLFNIETSNQPSEFEITFIEQGIRYQYGFSLNATRIIREWLLVYVERKPQCWFEREYNPETQKYNWNFGSHLHGSKQRSLWSESTRANALFLSTAVNLNSEQLRPIFNWFVQKLVVFPSNTQPLPFLTMEYIKNNMHKSELLQLFQAADLAITDVEFKTQRGAKIDFRVEAGKPPLVFSQEVVQPIATLFHKAKNNHNIGINLAEESQGTQRFFAFGGPILDILKAGKILVIDELDSSFHLKMVHFIINLFHNESLNQNNAQLIFSTHNTALLDNHIFRRDQIWFMEKDSELSSHLFPLTDFSPRKEEALEKGYLMGRYGALPFHGDFNL